MKNLIKHILLLLALLPVTAAAHDFEVNGIYYNRNGNEATVTYRGSYYTDYSNEYSGDISIPSTVKYNGTTYSVTSIGDHTFYACSDLASINIPNSVTNIGDYAFRYCSGLTSVTIGNSVTNIGNSAFYGCSGLTSVNIPNSVNNIGSGAFGYCTSLARITVDSGNPIYDSRFNCNAIIETATNTFIAGCKNTVIPNSVNNIGDYAFSGCSGLTSMTIPNSVTIIGKYAFSGCSGLTSMTIPNSVTIIGKYAFSGCSGLTRITIPNSVTNIDDEAFSGCTALTIVNITDIAAWCNISYGYYASNPLSYAHHLFLNGVEVTELNIPNSVTNIGNSAFSGCSGLTNVNIPNSVTNIGNHAFFGCSGLTNVNIPNSVNNIGSGAFSGCSGLINVNIPNSVTNIGGDAFGNCSGLNSVTIGNSVTSIGYNAFDNCSGLTSVNITDIAAWCNISFGGHYSNPLYYAHHLYLNGLEVTELTIPNFVTNIGNYAFYNCSGITSVNIPNSVTNIGSRAFYGCSSLTDVYSNIADPSVISMGNDVFYLKNEDYSNRTLHVPLGSIHAYQVDQKWRKCFTTIEDGDTVVTIRLKGELQIVEGGNEVHSHDTSIRYDQLWISYTGDEEVEFTILFDDYFEGGDYGKRDGERESFYLLNGDYVSEYVSWDDQNKRYIVDLDRLVLDDVFQNNFSSDDLDYFDIYCYFSFRITVHADGYNDLSKEYSGYSSHYHNVQGGGFPPVISSVSSDLTTFITVSYECSVHNSGISSPYNYIASYEEEYDSYGFDYYACERKDEDYYVTVYAEQHSAPEGIYWGETSKTILVPAKSGEYLTLSRFLDNEPHSNFYFLYGEGSDENSYYFNPDFAVIGEKESLAVVEFSQWLDPVGYFWEYYDEFSWYFESLFSIDGQTVYNNDTAPGPVVVDLLPYGNAFGGDHHFKLTVTDGYSSFTVDSVLSYHPIDTILTPYSLVIDVNSGMGGCSLFVDGEEVELSNDGPGTPAHIYALPRKDHDYSITVQVGNVIEYSELDVFYQGRCQETTIVVPAKEIFDYEEDGVYYSITSENEVIVVRGEETYQGVVIVPSTVTYDGVTYTVTGIGYDAFADADLTNLVLPVTISNIDSTAFTNGHIHSLIITGTGAWTAGAIPTNADELFVMSGVTGIAGLQMNPATVYSYSTVPPTCDSGSFTVYDAALHVPASALAAYFTAPYWSNFINITSDAIEPTGLSINKDSIELLIGNQLSLTANPTPANVTPANAIIWTSTNDSIATVVNGIITAARVGECEIKAVLLDKIATCHVTVTEIPPTSVTINPEFAKLESGTQLTLTATVLPEDATDKVVTWESTNSAVATVSSEGIVTAVAPGECFITATCRDNQATCHIIVVDHFIYVSLDEHNVRLLPNHMMTLSPSVIPEGASLVVTSSNPTVAAARMANGIIQVVGITEGKTVINVNSTDGYAEADSCLVTVYTERGDVNCDGFINISDVTSLVNRLLTGQSANISEVNADANNDGQLSIADVTRLINHLLSGNELDPKEEPGSDGLSFTSSVPMVALSPWERHPSKALSTPGIE